MGISFRIVAGQSFAAPNAANTIARLGVCANDDANGTVYTFDEGQDAIASLVGGPLAVCAQNASTYGGARHYAVKVNASTPGTISAVNKNGDSASPTPTVEGTDFDDVTGSPFDAFDVRLRYSTGGRPGAAVVDVALDGASYDYTFPTPPALPATQRGTVDVTGITWSTLNSATLIFTPDTSAAALKAATATSGSTVSLGPSDLLAPGLAELLLTPRALLFTTAGVTPSDAPASVDIVGTDAAGATISETLSLSQTAGTARSTKIYATITSLDYAAGDGTGATIAIGYGGTVTVTMPSTVADEDDVLGAFDDEALVAVFVQVGDARYLEVSGVALGSATGTLVAGAGTANSLLGFTSTTSTTGSDSTITLPRTGLTVTFPATADYVATKVHSFSTTAPKHSKADFDAALAALNEDIELDFGLVELVQEPADGTDLASYVTACDTAGAAWEAQPSKRFAHFVVPAPTGMTDAAVKAALASHTSVYTTVGARWVYQTAPSGLPSGSFPRSSARPLTLRAAKESFSEDPGFGGFGALPACSMTGPDGVTKAPDENTATTKLGGSDGPGFTVIKGKRQGGRLIPVFVRGVTRAGSDSLFVDFGVRRMILRAAALLFEELSKFENPTFDLNADGTIQENEAAALEGAWERLLRRELVQAKHASNATVQIDRAEKISQTRNLTVTYTVQERGQGEDITATLRLVGELVES